MLITSMVRLALDTLSFSDCFKSGLLCLSRNSNYLFLLLLIIFVFKNFPNDFLHLNSFTSFSLDSISGRPSLLYFSRYAQSYLKMDWPGFDFDDSWGDGVYLRWQSRSHQHGDFSLACGWWEAYQWAELNCQATGEVFWERVKCHKYP